MTPAASEGSAGEPAPVLLRRRRTRHPLQGLRRVLARRAVRRAILVVVGLGAALVVWSGVCGVLAAGHLRTARADVAGLSSGSLENLPALRTQVLAAQAEAAAAGALLHQVGPRAVEYLPVLGRSLTAARAVADVVSATLSAAPPLLDQAERIGSDGGIDLSRLAALDSALTAAAESTRGPLTELGDVDTRLVPRQLADAVQEVRTRLGTVDSTFARGAEAAAALHTVLGGEGTSTVLIGLENNTELRGTGGLVSVFALARATDGKLTGIDFRQVADVSPPSAAAAVRVPAPADYAEAYGPFLADTTLWQNTTMSPDIPSSAQVLAAVAEQATGVRADAVVLVDVPAMAAIVSATRPLTLADGSTLRGEDLVADVLVAAYGDGQFTDDQQTLRRLRLVQIANSAFGSLTSTLGTSARSDVLLLRALAESAQGRHLALWSRDARAQRALTVAGLDGGLQTATGQDLALVTVNNLGDGAGNGNKLDYYVSRSVDVEVGVGSDAVAVQQTVRLENRAPAGLGPYVTGFAPDATLVQLVELAVPDRATDATILVGGAPSAFTRHRAGGVEQLRVAVTLRRGQSVEVQLRYRAALLDGTYRLRVLPQPLARDATLSLRVRPTAGQSFVPAADGGLGLRRSGPFSQPVDVAVSVDRGPWWSRAGTALRDFWSSPVSLP